MKKERAIEMLDDYQRKLYRYGIKSKYNRDLSEAVRIARVALRILQNDVFSGIEVGDVCRYKNRDPHTDAREFIVTNIRSGQNGLGDAEQFFDAIYPDGTVLEDGTLRLIERAGGNVDVFRFLNQIQEEMEK